MHECTNALMHVKLSIIMHSRTRGNPIQPNPQPATQPLGPLTGKYDAQQQAWTDPKAEQTGLELQCVMALNAAASRIKTNVDTFAIFPKGYTPPPDIKALLDHHRIHTRHTSIHELWNASGGVQDIYGTSEVQRTMMLRFETFCVPHRSRVLYLDGDAFLTRADPEMWTVRDDENCVFSGGATSPAAGSAFLVKPSFKMCAKVRSAMQGPFTRETGWRGSGKMAVWPTCRCPLERMKTFCTKLQLPFDHETTEYPAMCQTEDGKMPWSFYAANADQGLLFHQCGAKSKYRNMKTALLETFDMMHYWGNQKPWKVPASKMTKDLDGGAAFKAALDSGILDGSACKRLLPLHGVAPPDEHEHERGGSAALQARLESAPLESASSLYASDKSKQISRKNKLVFAHVPKTGGTTIETSSLFADARTNHPVGGHWEIESLMCVCALRTVLAAWQLESWG